MKMAVVIPKRDNATVHYRVYLALYYWRYIEVVHYRLPDVEDEKITVADFCDTIKEPVVLIHRVNRINAMIASYLHVKKGKTILFDTDDQEYNLPADHHLKSMYQKHEVLGYLDTILKSADEAWVTTQALKRDMSKYTTHNIQVIPNAVDILHPSWHRKSVCNKYVNIGWVGGVSHLPDLPYCLKGLKRLVAENYSFTFTLCGIPKEQYKLVEVMGKKVKQDMPEKDRYETHIKKMFNFIPENHLILKDAVPLEIYSSFYDDIDIVIAPLADNAFNNCKSELKIIEAAARQIPIVASKTSSTYSDFAFKHPDTIFVVNNYESDWYKALKQLIEDPVLRAVRGHATYEIIDKEYNLMYWSNYREERVINVFNELS